MDKPNGLTVIYPGREAAFLEDLPTRTMSGIGPAAEKRLAALGITTLGQVARASEEMLHSVFGKNALMMRTRCQGGDTSPVEADDGVKSISNEMTFSTDLIELSEVRQAAAMLAAKVGRRLRRKGLAGHTVTLKVRYDDLSIHTAQRTLPAPVDDEQVYTPILWELIGEVWHPGVKLRLLGVGVSHFEARPVQLSLFEGMAFEDADENGRHSPAARPHKRSLVEATDKVKNRFGEHAVHYGRDFQFHDRDTGTLAQNKDGGYKD
jgi:DNA polymerase-4